MANKTVNQHYLPQLLLRGFAEDMGEKDSPVWVFRNGTQPFRTNPRNVGAERFFYADPDESPLEAELGRRETVLAAVVSAIREERRIPKGSETLLAELVGQMAVRNKHLREGFATAGEITARAAIDAVMEPEQLRRQARKALREKAAEFGVTIPAEQLERVAARFEPDFQEALKPLGGFTGMLDSLDFGAMVKKAQVDVLEEKLLDAGKRFESLRWQLLVGPGQSFVLGDVGPVALARRKRTAKPGVMFSPEHDLIALPLSDSVALVGGLENFGLEEINVERLNAAAAKLSGEFFVARENRPRERQLHSILGKDFKIWDRTAKKASQKAKGRWQR